MRNHRLAMFSLIVSATGVAAANPQYNGHDLHGIILSPDGKQMNGKQMNGTQLNGIQLNGLQLNGKQMNGTVLVGLQLKGTMLEGSLVDAPMCAHSESTAGPPLPASCNSCASIVCGSDPHCCSGAWDATCVNEAQGMCAFTAAQLVNPNTSLHATMINPDPNDPSGPIGVTLWIKSIQQPDNIVYSCKPPKPKCLPDAENCPDPICTSINKPALGPNADVHLYNIVYQLDGAAGPPQALCPSTDLDGYSNLAVPVSGGWESRVGSFTNAAGQSWTGGGKIPGTDGNTFTFGCRDVGAIAKCIERVGYKPWLTRTALDANGLPDITVTLDAAHQACVRMLRADYCGNGQAHTKDGTVIDVADGVGWQSQSTTYPLEAEWTPQGATCISKPRWYGLDASCDKTSSVYDPLCPSPNYSTMQYVQDHCPNNYQSYLNGLFGCGGSSHFDYLSWAAGTPAVPLANLMDWSSTLALPPQ